jgi:hypothetical protein
MVDAYLNLVYAEVSSDLKNGGTWYKVLFWNLKYFRCTFCDDLDDDYSYIILKNDEKPLLILNILFHTVKMVNICFIIVYAHTDLYVSLCIVLKYTLAVSEQI